MTQEAAFVLNIKGSSETIQSLLQLEKSIAANAQEIKELKIEAGKAEKDYAKFVKQSKTLEATSKLVRTELEKVTGRMKELLAANKGASKEYATLKARKKELVSEEVKLSKAIEINTKNVERQNDIYTKAKQRIEDYTRVQLKNRAEHNQLSKAARQQATTFNALAAAAKLPEGSIAQLEVRLKLLRAQFVKLTDTERLTPFGRKLNADITTLDAKVKQLRATMGQFQANVGNYPGLMNSAGTSMLNFGKQALGAFGVGSALYVGVGLLKTGVSSILDFEKGLDELSGITGAVGDELKFLGNEALRISKNFGTASVEMLRVFQLLGGLRPELLDNSKAMVEMAENADILANGGLIDIDTAVIGITKALAAFDLDSEHSGIVINQLAKSAQEGAAQINHLIESIDAAGGVAKTSGVSFKEFAALNEALASKGILGAEAGRVLRNVFIQLTQLGRKDLNPIYTDMADILDTLAVEITDAGEAAAVFQKENAEGVLKLIQARQEYRRHIDLNVEYNEAQLLAATNTENTTNKIEKLNTAFKNLFISIEEGSGIAGTSIGFVADQLTGLLNKLSEGDISDLVGLLTPTGGRAFEKISNLLFGEDPKAEVDEKLKEVSDAVTNAMNLLEVQAKDSLSKIELINLQRSSLEGLDQLSIKQLKELRKFYNAQAPITKAGQEFLTQTLKNITEKIFEKSGRDGAEAVVKFAEGSIGFLEERIKELQDVLKNTTDVTVITTTTQQIVELEKQLSLINEELTKARRNAEGVPSVLNPLAPTQTTEDILQNVGEATIGFDLARLENANDQELAMLKAHEEQKQIVKDEMKQRDIDRNDELLESQIQMLGFTEVLFQGLANNMSGLFSDSEEEQHEALKNLLLDLLSYAEKVLLIQIPIIVAKELALKGFAGIATSGVLIGLAKVAFAGVRAAIESYEEGGVIKGGVKFRRPGTSDDTLAHVKQGEMILTEHNQSELKKHYGEDVFATAGVKGFKQSAINNHISVLNKNSSGSTSLDSDSIEVLADVMSDRVALAIIQRTTFNRIYDRDKLTRPRRFKR